ncbi:MAG: hypothetical protein HY606_01465 [Planctomycetes bacterium]|nr:hypothetical protein [Planctomycetota bacterium]
MKKLLPLVVLAVGVISVIILKQYQNNSTQTQKDNTASHDKKAEQSDSQQDKSAELNPTALKSGKTDKQQSVPTDDSTDQQKNQISRTVTITGVVTDRSNNPVGTMVRALITKEKSKSNPPESIQMVPTDAEGKFSIQLKYTGSPGEPFTLHVGLNNSFMRPAGPREPRESFPRSSKVEPHELKSMFPAMVNSGKCYCTIQQFTLTEAEQAITANFQCMLTSTLTIEVQAQDFQPKDATRISSSLPSFMSPNSATIIIMPEGLSWTEAFQQNPFEAVAIAFVKIGESSTIEVPADTNMEIICTLQGYGDKTEKVSPLAPEQNKYLKFFLEKATGKLSGICVNEDGAPIAAAKISLNQEGISLVVSASKNDGTFTVESILEKNVNEIRFWHNDYEELVMNNVNINNPVKAVMKGTKKTSLKGRCVNKNGGPIAGVRIHCRQGRRSVNSTSNPDGTFSVQVAEGIKIDTLLFFTSGYKHVNMTNVSPDSELTVTMETQKASTMETQEASTGNRR